MDYFLRFVQPWFLFVLGPMIIIGLIIRRYVKIQTSIRHSLAGVCKKRNLQTYHPYKKVFFLLRFVILSLLALLITKPQIVDSRSEVKMKGVDIVLSIDMSASMMLPSHSNDRRSRFDIAKQEAIRFVEKRTNDAIGLVIFGTYAVSRCPLTMDKNALKQIIQELQIGLIDADQTVIGRTLVTAANRLKKSTAKSKIIILLTDGEPTVREIPIVEALEVVKKFGIKVYTIGIGAEGVHSLFMAPSGCNKHLLKLIAEKTNGKFFLAHNAQDMRSIYDTIDALETTEQTAPVFSKYYDLCIPAAAIIMALLLIEVFLSSLVWFSI